ncbi:unnamed protein product [Rhizophagus irregularis]|nr:unnamed protein product [Rhizophagus irregularis]
MLSKLKKLLNKSSPKVGDISTQIELNGCSIINPLYLLDFWTYNYLRRAQFTKEALITLIRSQPISYYNYTTGLCVSV